MIENLSNENLDEMIDLLHKMHAASGWKHVPIDEDHMRKNIAAMIGKSSFLACLYRTNGKVIGMMMASLGSFFFSKSLFGIENGMFVLPEHRGGRAAVSLYREFDKWCEQNNAEPFIEIFFSDDTTNEKVYQFFRKNGFEDCGKMFRRNKKWDV